MTITKAKVSVCMITYNHELYVARAIESILTQQTNFDFELVIGEDSGTDRTLEICREFARKDKRVRLLPSDRNLGVMMNFLRTLQACGGEYVAVCEGDDYWTDPMKLFKQADLLDRNPAYAGSAHQSVVLVHEMETTTFNEDVPVEIGVNDLLAGRLFHTASILFRQPAIRLFENSPPVLSCDRLLNFCVALRGVIHFSRESMCVYRRHGEGLSAMVTVSELRRDLNCVPYLKRLCPAFPSLRYKSYVYASIGLCGKASAIERIHYITLFFIYSFAYFPRNIALICQQLSRRVFRGLAPRS